MTGSFPTGRSRRSGFWRLASASPLRSITRLRNARTNVLDQHRPRSRHEAVAEDLLQDPRGAAGRAQGAHRQPCRPGFRILDRARFLRVDHDRPHRRSVLPGAVRGADRLSSPDGSRWFRWWRSRSWRCWACRLQRKVVRAAKEAQADHGLQQTLLVELIAGIETLKSIAGEGTMLGRWRQLANERTVAANACAKSAPRP